METTPCSFSITACYVVLAHSEGPVAYAASANRARSTNAKGSLCTCVQRGYSGPSRQQMAALMEAILNSLAEVWVWVWVRVCGCRGLGTGV
eukprot:1160114-Pelagomonas_calceolata.AAC.25